MLLVYYTRGYMAKMTNLFPIFFLRSAQIKNLKKSVIFCKSVPLFIRNAKVFMFVQTFV